MNVFLELRNRLRTAVVKYEKILNPVLMGMLMFLGLHTLRESFGYFEFLSHGLVCFAISVVCAFLPTSVCALVLGAALFLHLSAMSAEVAVLVLGLFLLSIFFSRSYHAQQPFQLVALPLLNLLGVPSISPLFAGLFAGWADGTTILCGSVIAFYLRTVRDNTAVLMDASLDYGALDLLSLMIANPKFYVFLSAMTAMYAIVMFLRNRSISHAWLFAVIFGVLTELVIMLGGDLFMDEQASLPALLLGSLVTLLIGLLIYYLFQDFDYYRVERVQFEDDEYYYYVTAVPKIRITEEKKEVKEITGVSGK